MAQVSKPQLSFSTGMYILGAILVLAVPIRWLLAWTIAAVLHECFRCLAVILTGKRIRSICIGAFGAEIHTDPLQPIQTVVCALSGPLAGFLLLPFAKFLPRIALCATAQSVCNLLPVQPLDGNVAMRGFLQMLFSEETTVRICDILQKTMVALLIFLGGYAAWRWKLGNLPLVFAAVLLLRGWKRKIPCKYGLYRVQ